jgi:hypothetical protein
MNKSLFIIATASLFLSFAPGAFAQSCGTNNGSCTTTACSSIGQIQDLYGTCPQVGQYCCYSGTANSSGNSGTGQTTVSATGNAVCQAYGQGTGCTTSSGASGICDASNICQPTNTQVTPNNPAPSGSSANTGSNVTLINPLQGGGTLEGFLQSILAFVVRIGTIVVILMLVFVGYKFVAAQGNETALTEARKMLLWTVVGALILLGAQALSLGIQATVNALSSGN